MGKNSWVSQWKESSNQSVFHNTVREIFCKDSFFRNLHCYQEVNVQELIEDYEVRNHHYDWYIEELNMVIELHGNQHYKMVNYGNIGYDAAIRSFRKMQGRDNMKKQAALDAGYTFVEIPYKYARRLNPKLLRKLLIGEDS